MTEAERVKLRCKMAEVMGLQDKGDYWGYRHQASAEKWIPKKQWQPDLDIKQAMMVLWQLFRRTQGKPVATISITPVRVLVHIGQHLEVPTAVGACELEGQDAATASAEAIYRAVVEAACAEEEGDEDIS